jgi:HPt (histidine-containing phosphotransfer) domain-containing protein/PAS domain-containing protein/anti-sigma regulatory factor (Ser/Thr protein kinase)
MSSGSDPNRILDTLKAKATLLIQREREVYALRLGRERMMAWLHAFHGISVARPEAGADLCAEWVSLMVTQLHFQTAGAFLLEPSTGELSLLSGQSHGPLPERLSLDEAGRRVLRVRREGLFNLSGDPDAVALAQTLRLQSFLWFVFPNRAGTEILLAAGIAAGVVGAQAALSNDDLVYFTMLGRHIAVLLSNSNLIADLGAARRSLQELFDHMRQAIVTFDASGQVGSISSRQAKVVFERENLEGCSIRDLLYPGALEHDVDALAFAEWLELVLNAPASDWAASGRFAPREVTIVRKAGVTPLELEFQPMVRDGRITQVMLLATDVTLERKLERAVRSHEAEHARRVAAMRRLIAGGTQVFLAFVESARERLDRCEQLIQTHSQRLPVERIDELFRQTHTLRGEARAFHLVELEDMARRMEEDLDELRGEARGDGRATTGSVATRLQAALLLVRKAIEKECELLVDASPAGAAVFDQVTVPRSALRDLAEYAAHESAHLSSLVERLSAVPFGVTAAGVADSVAGWAEAQGVAVALQIERRELLVPQSLASVLPGVLTHLVRNAVAHGIESPAERRAAGKAEQGTIRIEAHESSRGVSILVEDDGRGLDAGRLLRAAGDRVSSSVDASELAFLPGVTTRAVADELAGRGVGLDAVRTELAQIGYTAALSTTPGRGTRITLACSLLDGGQGPIR